MLLCCLCQILSLPSECCSRNQTHQLRQRFLNLPLFNSIEPVLFVALVSCFWLTGVAHRVVFCSCGQSDSRFDLSCIQSGSAYLGCNKWLFDIPLPFYYLKPVRPFLSDLWHQQDIYTRRNSTYCIFSPSWNIFFKQ